MNYFNKLDNIIEDFEVNKRVRALQDNHEALITYWNIGKLIVEAQGGEARAKYGNGLIKAWSKKLTEKYGKGYDDRSLRNMRLFYIKNPIWSAVRTISWTHYKLLLKIKNINEYNYYINQTILNNLSTRELDNLIKSQAFERLSYADKNNIELISPDKQLTIEDMIKNPIIIHINEDISQLDEKTIHKYIINMLENKFLELGNGFALIGHEYKLNIMNKTYRIDLLFFNIEINSYIVVEIKRREIQPKDISQLQFYVNYIDKNLKKSNHNKTIGILVVEKDNDLIVEYTINNNIYITTYILES